MIMEPIDEIEFVLINSHSGSIIDRRGKLDGVLATLSYNLLMLKHELKDYEIKTIRVKEVSSFKDEKLNDLMMNYIRDFVKERNDSAKKLR
jgi:hypothetical protein